MSAPAFAVRGVLFDLDGTLVDSVADLSVASKRMLAELGRPPCPEADIRRYVGKGMAVLVQRCLAREEGEVDPALQAAGIEAFRRHYRAVNGRYARVYAGVTEALEAMRGRGLALGCVTNKPQDFTLALLEQTKLGNFFGVVVGGDVLARKKPEPDMLFHACAALGVPPGQTLMIGDSANDALAARAAGIPVVLTTYGYTEGVAVDTIDCDGLVSSVTEVLPWIRPADPAPSGTD